MRPLSPDAEVRGEPAPAVGHFALLFACVVILLWLHGIDALFIAKLPEWGALPGAVIGAGVALLYPWLPGPLISGLCLIGGVNFTYYGGRHVGRILARNREPDDISGIAEAACGLLLLALGTKGVLGT